ncbi:LacI family DNA-binding transcriptional regulator [Dactylosporangium siamense]|uniref:LacI family transcriptional regulator n=1 Tax=Dactylosporangium siamense TaxID=685454 RepID=A0A919PQU7_9ACTN|nr:LacI family DNA-binding transcriptional regulator [Dactylosporangium siamense]GIG48409.1 LacI family transcriptional regulator [Dactylosporangium siamense]
MRFSSRVTIRQVATHAGVSEAAVSYALNGRPGVSEQTRAKVLAAAGELGWAPNIAARSLGLSRANAIGLVLVRPPRELIVDSYLTQMLSGVEAALNRDGMSLLLHLVAEVDDTVEVYRRWWAGRHVDGVIVTDVREDDPRIDALVELGLPAAVIGGHGGLDPISTVDGDAAGTAGRVVEHLRARGHRSVARVAGTAELLHTRQRDLAYLDALERAGIDRYLVLYTNYSAMDGMSAMLRLMSGSEPPTAVVFDNDVMAAAALKVVHDMGMAVPGDVSVVAWDDSDLCQLTVPTITAVEQAPAHQAELTAQALLRTLHTGEVTHATVPPGTLHVRQST